jgi:hypothetical protein
MTDAAFALLLALVSTGVGIRLLRALGQTPEHPLDALGLALPLGLGLMALATLALGELGCLNRTALAIAMGILMAVGTPSLIGLIRSYHLSRHVPFEQTLLRGPAPLLMFCAVIGVLGSALSAGAPVTDGDALCYHLQVPKVFLSNHAVVFDPDLHETIYPLVTELVYTVGLAICGPVTCRWIQWFLGLAFAANVVALARPNLGQRAWWSGAIALLVPAVSNGMSAPLNDVALAAFGTAAILTWARMHARPSCTSAIVGGLFAGLAIGVKYPALILFVLLTGVIVLRAMVSGARNPEIQWKGWVALALIYLTTAAAAGGWWYLRAYAHTGNPVYPFFRAAFNGAGLDEVLDPMKRPLPVNALNMLVALWPISLEPARFDSFSHQLGPVFLLFLPALLFERAPRRMLLLLALAYLFLALCMTQRQSMRFLLVAVGPMSILVAHLATIWCDRRTIPARLVMVVFFGVLGLEAAVAAVRCRHALPVIMERESVTAYLARCEPTFAVGQWVAGNLPGSAHVIGQDHRGFYIPRAYTMELAHRRRTGLGRSGETSDEIVARLIESGFTHVMLCPPVPETAVEFDPTLGRLLAPWLAKHTPLFRQNLTDGDGVLRQYAIYELTQSGLATSDNAMIASKRARPGGIAR